LSWEKASRKKTDYKAGKVLTKRHGNGKKNKKLVGGSETNRKP